MSNGNYKHDPNAVLDYTWDWSDWLPAGDSIASYQLLPQAGVTVNSHSQTGAQITAWLQASGSVGARLAITCRVTTTGGRTDDRTKYLLLIER